MDVMPQAKKPHKLNRVNFMISKHLKKITVLFESNSSWEVSAGYGKPYWRIGNYLGLFSKLNNKDTNEQVQRSKVTSIYMYNALCDNLSSKYRPSNRAHIILTFQVNKCSHFFQAQRDGVCLG